MSKPNQKKKRTLTLKNIEAAEIRNRILSLGEVDPKTKVRRVRTSFRLDLAFSKISRALFTNLEPLGELEKRQREERAALNEKRQSELDQGDTERDAIEKAFEEEKAKLNAEWEETLNDSSEYTFELIPASLLDSDAEGPGPEFLERLSDLIDFDA